MGIGDFGSELYIIYVFVGCDNRRNVVEATAKVGFTCMFREDITCLIFMFAAKSVGSNHNALFCGWLPKVG